MGRPFSARRLMEIDTRHTMLPPPPSAEAEGWDRSWRYLFETYTPAMCRYVRTLLRGIVGGGAETEAEDVVQAYLTACVEKGWLARDAAEIRSFRSWLKMQLFRFTCDWIDRMRAAKRQAAGSDLGPDVLLGMRARVMDPADAAFDRELVEAAIESALRKLADRSEDQAEVMRDLLRRDGAASSDLADRLDRNASQLAALTRRARVAFAGLLAVELRTLTRDEHSFARLLEDLDPYLP